MRHGQADRHTGVDLVSAGNFGRCLAVAWLPENDGQPLHTTPGDAGGATRLGVTFANFAAWRQHNGQPAPSLDAFAAADTSELSALIETWIWTPIAGEHLPLGADLIAFEMAFGSGPGEAARLMQAALGVPRDGDIGPVTLAAATAMDPAGLVRLLTAAHRSYVDCLGEPAFQGGWDARIDRDEATALGWLNSAPA